VLSELASTPVDVHVAKIEHRLVGELNAQGLAQSAGTWVR